MAVTLQGYAEDLDDAHANALAAQSLLPDVQRALKRSSDRGMIGTCHVCRSSGGSSEFMVSVFGNSDEDESAGELISGFPQGVNF